MNRRIAHNNLLISLILFILFCGFTLFVKFGPQAAIGPNGAIVGMPHLNQIGQGLFPVKWTLYVLTDWMGLIPILTGMIYGVVGLFQWISRKKITRVDPSILILGIFYVIVFLVYLFFETVTINHRPVLIDGILEKSYPSSTILLAICFLIPSISQSDRLLKKRGVRRIIKTMTITFMVVMVVGRLFSGVHWLSDIIGSGLISTALVLLMRGVIVLIPVPQEKNMS